MQLFKQHGLNRKINYNINQNIQFFFKLHNYEKINTISSFQNLQQYIITHQPRPTKLDDITNLVNKQKPTRQQH